MLYLLELALGPRVMPHRVVGGVLELRRGAFYRVRVPLAAIAGAELRRERAERPLELGEARARLSARGRSDLVLSLSEAALIERPLGDPVPVTSIAVAADDPAGMLAAIEEERSALALAAEPTRRRAALDAASSLAWGVATSS